MEKKHKSRNLVKGVTFLFGVITILGLMGYLIFNMFTANNSPPNLTVSTFYDSQHKVHKVVVKNAGDTTAEEVITRWQIIGEGRVIDTITITMRYLPAKSQKSATVCVPKNESLQVNIQIISINYQTP